MGPLPGAPGARTADEDGRHEDRFPSRAEFPAGSIGVSLGKVKAEIPDGRSLSLMPPSGGEGRAHVHRLGTVGGSPLRGLTANL